MSSDKPASDKGFARHPVQKSVGGGDASSGEVVPPKKPDEAIPIGSPVTEEQLRRLKRDAETVQPTSDDKPAGVDQDDPPEGSGE
jgi:hypothetical protein